MIFSHAASSLTPGSTGPVGLQTSPATSSGDPITYIVLAVLILIGAFFAASEIAIISVRKTRIKQLAEEGNRSARIVTRLTENPTRFLATIQIGVTLAGFFASAFGAERLASEAGGLFAFIPDKAIAGTIGFITVTILIAFMTLIFSELVPKTLAVNSAERIALVVARPIEIMSIISRPIVAMLTGLTNVIVRIFGSDTRATMSSVTPEEIVSMVNTGQEEGVVDKLEQQVIQGVFDFSDLVVREVMVPRIDMAMLEADTTVVEASRKTLDSGYSRYPVYDDDRDNIKGVVYAKDLLTALTRGEDERKIGELVRLPRFVPEAKRVGELFREMQVMRSHLVIVVDEYGGVSGLVTLEDLLEEIVGDIQDEFDHETRLIQPLPPPENEPPTGAREYLVAGRTPLNDVCETTGVDIEESEDFDTIAGFVLSQLGHIPAVGETVSMADGEIIVTRVRGQRIDQLKVIHRPPDRQDDDENERDNARENGRDNTAADSGNNNGLERGRRSSQRLSAEPQA